MTTNCRRWALILALPLLFHGCAWLRSPERTVTSFLSAAGKGEIDTAMGLLSSRTLALGEAKIKAGLQKYASDVAEKGGLQSAAAENVVVNGQVATAVGISTFGNGTVSREKVQLLKEDGAWKVDIHK